MENLELEQHVSDAKEEEDFKPPTRAFRVCERKRFERHGERNLIGCCRKKSTDREV